MACGQTLSNSVLSCSVTFGSTQHYGLKKATLDKETSALTAYSLDEQFPCLGLVRQGNSQEIHLCSDPSTACVLCWREIATFIRSPAVLPRSLVFRRGEGGLPTLQQITGYSNVFPKVFASSQIIFRHFTSQVSRRDTMQLVTVEKNKKPEHCECIVFSNTSSPLTWSPNLEASISAQTPDFGNTSQSRVIFIGPSDVNRLSCLIQPKTSDNNADQTNPYFHEPKVVS